MSSRAVVGREVPLRVLGRSARSRRRGRHPWRCCPARRGSARRGSWARSRRWRAASSSCTASASSSAAASWPTRRSPPRCGACRRSGPATGSTSSRSRRAARWPRCCRARCPAPAARRRLHELLLDLLGRLAAERAPVLLVARGRALGRSVDARAARVPGPQPARAADRGRRHLPRRRRLAGRAAAARRGALAPALGPADRARAARAATTSRASWRRSPAARSRPRSPASCTRAPAATRSSSRSCSRPATRCPASVTEAVLARVERLDQPALGAARRRRWARLARAAGAARRRAGRAPGGARRRRPRAHARTASRSGTG